MHCDFRMKPVDPSVTLLWHFTEATEEECNKRVEETINNKGDV